MKIKVLKAGPGDAILVSFDGINILVDGGSKKEYKKTLKKEIEAIVCRHEKLDLVIVTHLDDDHLMGILELLKDIKQGVFSKSIIGKLWFQIPPNINTTALNGNIGDISAVHAKDLEEILKEMEIDWENNSIFIPDSPKKNDYSKLISNDLYIFPITGTSAQIIILSPTKALLDKFKREYEKEWVSSDTAGTSDYDIPLSKFENFDKDKDSSSANGSSIAFLLKYNDENIALFLGDSFPDTIVHSLKILGHSNTNPIEVKYVKLAHHGSKRSTSCELFQSIYSNNFIISTSGVKDHLPNKKLISKLLKTYNNRLKDKGEKINLLFNYGSEYYRGLFTPQDLDEYSDILNPPIYLDGEILNVKL